jgi:peptide/nickel transport system substrate-binding protein
VRDSHLIINRNPDYVADQTQTGTDGYAGRKIVNIDAVRYNFVPEANARVAAMRAGEADIAGIVPPELAKTLDGQPNVAAQTVFPGCMSVIMLHSQNPPTDNPLVREAIAAVLNADDIIDAAGLVAKQQPSILYPDSPYYDVNNAAPYYNQHNIAKAKDLLAKAGYKGEKIILLTNATYPAMRDSLLVLSQAMQAAGMNADLQVVDFITNGNAMQRGLKTWNVSTSWFCSQPLLGPQQWRPIIYNYTQVTGNAVLDAAFQNFSVGLRVEDRKAAWGEAERELLGKAYVIKVSDFGWMYGYNRRIKGLQPWYSLRFWNVTAQ